MGRTPDPMYIIVVIFLVIMLLIAIFSPFHRKKRKSYWERKSALWFQELTRRFQERFPNQSFHVDEPDPTNKYPVNIVVPPKHSAVGELRIYDLGTRITVEINPFLHEDIDLVERNLDEGREALVAEVLLFLDGIFEDKIECFGRPNGCSHRERGQKPRSSLNKLLFGKTTYVWSGPIEEKC